MLSLATVGKEPFSSNQGTLSQEEILNVRTVVLLSVHKKNCTAGPVWRLHARWHAEHCCSNRADILEGFHRGTAAKATGMTKTKSCQTAGTRSPPARHVASPLRHIRRVGWSAFIIHATTQGDICEAVTCHRGIMDQMVER